MTPDASAQFPRPKSGSLGAPMNQVAPPTNPELHWIAEMNLSIDRERQRLGLQPRHELRSPNP